MMSFPSARTNCTFQWNNHSEIRGNLRPGTVLGCSHTPSQDLHNDLLVFCWDTIVEYSCPCTLLLPPLLLLSSHASYHFTLCACMRGQFAKIGTDRDDDGNKLDRLTLAQFIHEWAIMKVLNAPLVMPAIETAL